MYLFRSIALGALCSLFLSSCTSVMWATEEQGVAEAPGEIFQLEVDDQGEPVLFADGGAQMDMNMDEAAAYISNSNVQVFSLDAPAAPVGEPMVKGVRAGKDPNVVVYPFDDDFGTMYQHAEIPALMPPPAPGRTFSSPFTGQGELLPVPGDGSYLIQNGQGRAVAGQATVYFAHDSSDLNATARESLGQIAQAVSGQIPTPQIKVEGHASSRTATKDTVRKRIINLRVSMNRALSVSRALMRKGVPATAIQTTAWGDTRPAQPVPGMDAEAASRRVEVYTKSVSQFQGF